MLVRFAGPRLENGGDELLPVPLRVGGRTLGGALSWSTPQKLAPIEDTSLFAGTPVPPEVTVSRQVLADPAMLGPDVHVWARLQDGTPLVTERKFGEGQIILFHVTANSDWSNLPLSGLFVEMLRRISALGSGVADGGDIRRAANEAGAPDSPSVLPPLQTLDGFGILMPPPPTAQPVPAAKVHDLVPSLDHPPGYYGAGGSPRAVNVLGPKSVIAPLPALPAGAERLSYASESAQPLKSWLLLAALALLFADIIAVILLQAGGFALWRTSRRGPAHAALAFAVVGAVALVIATPDARAQAPAEPATQESAVSTQAADERAIEATSKVTHRLRADRRPERRRDQPPRPRRPRPPARRAHRRRARPPDGRQHPHRRDRLLPGALLAGAARRQGAARGDARQDRRLHEAGRPHHLRHAGLSAAASPAAGSRRASGESALQRIIGKLDMPRLEPVPENHVLTKAFYLLRNFPGRWDGGQLWVEALEGAGQDQSRRARVSDGVTSIIVTPNDLAAAWALDESGRPLYPTVGGGEDQREMAFRTGINIVMHALTGNYKADQVHVPALLERLGQ